MATITVSILSLNPTTTPSSFLTAFKASSLEVITIARVIQWIITPIHATHLTSHTWHFMLILPPSTSLPTSLTSLCSRIYSIRILESESFVKDFKEKNYERLHPKEEDIPTLTNLGGEITFATSSQNVELTPSLLAFSKSPLCPKGPVSMLNYISLIPSPSSQESYAAYIKEFTSSVGAEKGGVVKMLGEVEEEAKGEWDEVVVAQYSTLAHFADMCAYEAYQRVNRALRLPVMRDTGILMTTEVEVEWGG